MRGESNLILVKRKTDTPALLCSAQIEIKFAGKRFLNYLNFRIPENSEKEKLTIGNKCRNKPAKVYHSVLSSPWGSKRREFKKRSEKIMNRVQFGKVKKVLEIQFAPYHLAKFPSGVAYLKLLSHHFIPSEKKRKAIFKRKSARIK